MLLLFLLSSGRLEQDFESIRVQIAYKMVSRPLSSRSLTVSRCLLTPRQKSPPHSFTALLSHFLNINAASSSVRVVLLRDLSLLEVFLGPNFVSASRRPLGRADG